MKCLKSCVMNMLNLINKFPDKIEFEVDYIVYTYDNFKFYLKKVKINDEIGLWFHLQNTVKESLEWKEKTKLNHF